MRLSNAFITYDTGTESMLVPTGNAEWSGLVRGNRTLGAILELLKEDTTEEAIMSAMKARFDAPEEVITADVRKALDNLRKIGALDEQFHR